MAGSVSYLCWMLMILGAVALDWLIGDPANIPHPIVWIGKLIGRFTKLLNTAPEEKASSRAKGLLMWIAVIAITGAVTAGVQWLCLKIHFVLFIAVTVWFLGTTLAEKSLRQAVESVEAAVNKGNLASARQQVGYLCGRDTSALSEHEIIRATVETTAENTIDGVLAPLFYMFLGVILQHFVWFLSPLTLAMVYKAVNTMDSMTGYVQAPYTHYGYFPAKLDDAFNYLIARLGSWVMLASGGIIGDDFKNGRRIYKRDKGNHRSPNAGHPESAVAGLLHIQIGGTNIYFGQVVEKPTIGDADEPLSAAHIKKSLRIMTASEVGLAFLGAVIYVAAVFLRLL
jgi:adenosylcobinamide-phosphate synthase